MFFFFVSGSQSRRDELGVVADYCPRCRRIRPHRVAEYYRVSHVYFIPLGEGQNVGASRECFRCGTEYLCEPDDYATILDVSGARSLGLERLLRVTNPRLFRALEGEGRDQEVQDQNPRPVRDVVAEPAPSRAAATRRAGLDQATEERQTEALRNLSPHVDFDRQAVILSRELRELSQMAAGERDILFERVDEYLDRRRRLDAVLTLTEEAARSFPSGVTGLILGAVFLAAISAIWWVPLDWPAAALVAYAAGVIVAGLTATAWWTTACQRRWFRGVYIPTVEGAGHDAAEAYEALDGAARSRPGLCPAVYRVAGRADLLRPSWRRMASGRTDVHAPGNVRPDSGRMPPAI